MDLGSVRDIGILDNNQLAHWSVYNDSKLQASSLTAAGVCDSNRIIKEKE